MFFVEALPELVDLKENVNQQLLLQKKQQKQLQKNHVIFL